MKPLYASFLFLFLTATPGLQAWGLPTGGQVPSKPAKSAQNPAKKTTKRLPAKTKMTVRASKPLAAAVSPRRVSIREAAIQLRKPSLLEQARTLTQQEVLARFDGNLDGRLNAKEASAARLETEKRKGLKAGLLKRFDDNKNGRLDAAEMSRARAEFAANRRKQTLAKYDRNHNGLLDPVERKCLQTDRERAQALVQLQRRFDLNHDEVLNESELSAMALFQTEQARLGLDPLDGKSDGKPAKPSKSSAKTVAPTKKTVSSKSKAKSTPKSQPSTGGVEPAPKVN